MLSMPEPLPIKAVELIFDWMIKRYGTLFIDMWSWSSEPGYADVKKAWAEELSGFTEAELRTGLIACKRYCEMPPTLPRFLRLCRPPVEYEPMFYEAVRCMALRGTGLEKWPSAAVYWAAVKIGAFELKNSSWATLQKRWVSALDEMLSDTELPPIPERTQPLLPEPGRTMIREGGLSAILCGMKQEGSHKSWAHKIFRRYERGEKLQEYVLVTAEEALGKSRPVRGLEAA